MAWKPTYDSRNRANLAKLADNTKAAALKWYDYLIDNKIDLLIYETIRTEAQQRANVAKGASQTMKSYHLVGQALDFVPVNGKTTLWNGYGSADVKRAVAYAKKLGFEWGGDWSGFVDKPHLQFNYRGYGTDTFGKKVSNVTSKPSASAPKKSSSYPLPDGVIKVTKPLTKGTKVAQVQTALAACYFYPDKGAKNNGIDGYYGPKTANAVKRFQLMNGLVADGIYGPKTKAKLAAKLK